MSILDPSSCRICLNPDSAFVNAFGYFHTKSVPKMLGELFKLKMNANPNLPQFICETCLTIILKAEALRNTSLKNEKFLVNLASTVYLPPAKQRKVKDDLFEIDIIDERILVEDEERERPITPIEDPVISAESEIEDVDWTPYIQLNDTVKEVKKKEKTTNTSYYCSYCFREFNTRQKCVYHEKAKHQPKPAFETRPYICDRCGMTFKAKGHLQNHLNVVHLKVKNYQCNICGFAMYSKTHHRSHMLGHMDVRDYKCIQCGKAFTRKESLQAHQRTHTDARPYKCKYCEKTYTAHSDLKRHIFTHTRTPPYTCQLCNGGFHLKRLLCDHVTICHPGIDTTSWLTGKTAHNFFDNV